MKRGPLARGRPPIEVTHDFEDTGRKYFQIGTDCHAKHPEASQPVELRKAIP